MTSFGIKHTFLWRDKSTFVAVFYYHRRNRWLSLLNGSNLRDRFLQLTRHLLYHLWNRQQIAYRFQYRLWNMFRNWVTKRSITGRPNLLYLLDNSAFSTRRRFTNWQFASAASWALHSTYTERSTRDSFQRPGAHILSNGRRVTRRYRFTAHAGHMAISNYSREFIRNLRSHP